MRHETFTTETHPRDKIHPVLVPSRWAAIGSAAALVIIAIAGGAGMIGFAIAMRWM